MFAKFGLPETVVTDNGSGFVSEEFEMFLRKNGIKHTTSAPYHPATNELAERAVQIVKRGLKKVTDGSMNTRLAKVLLAYRITPHSTTGVSPAELLLGRRVQTRLDLLKPHTAERVESNQNKQKVKHDAGSKSRTFQTGDSVFAKNFGVGCRWLPGKIVKKTGPVSFHVHLEDGRQRRCHQDHLRLRVVDDGTPEMSEVVVDDSFPITTDETVEQEVNTQPTTQEAVLPVPTGTSELPQPNESNVRTHSEDSIARNYPR